MSRRAPEWLFQTFHQWLRGTLCDIAEKYGAEPDPSTFRAIKDAERAIAGYLLRTTVGKKILKLERITPNLSSRWKHALLLLFVERDPDFLRSDETVNITHPSPELFELIASVIQARRKRGVSLFFTADRFPLGMLICSAWPIILHRASHTAGCAICCATSNRRITLEAYIKELMRLGLKAPPDGSAPITLENVAEHVESTKPYIRKIREERASRRMK